MTGSRPSAPGQQLDRAKGGGPRVLIVEDESLVAMTLEDQLLESGYFVVGPYTRLDEALSAARTTHVDIGIIDLSMNGQFTYPIAEVLAARNIPWIFLTGFSAQSLPESYRATPCITKPYEFDELQSEIRRLLRFRRV